MIGHTGNTDVIEAMFAAPDDVDSDDGRLKDATGWAGSGIAPLSSSRVAQRDGRRGSEKTVITRLTNAHSRDELELEAQIKHIRARYRCQERVLEEEIARLEQTYQFALAELDAGQSQQGEDIDCSAGDNWDWETTSEYPPTEPRGKSRSPSPALAR